MEEGTGMVAVVRGLRGAGLAVTLLDSGKQYTLVPNSMFQPKERNMQRSAGTDSSYDRVDSSFRCDSSAQATDGRYASVYQTTHCKVNPTSPPVQLTEFPPQRSEVCRGHDNFVVGGTGSGDMSHNVVRSNGSFRSGGLIWSDKGSVCSPRPSREPDAFANSLRKYPALSPDRSTEIVERLVSYTQAKNFFKSSRYQCPGSPTRNSDGSEHVTLDREVTRTINKQHSDAEAKTKAKIEESPTRDKSKKEFEYLEYRKPVFSRNYDVRYLRDMSKRVRENIRNLTACGPHQQLNCPCIPESYVNDHRNSVPESRNQNMVNSEIQAAAKMVCKEVATEPRAEPSKRNVAVLLSPTTSDSAQMPQGGVSSPKISPSQHSFKCVQATFPLKLPDTIRKSVQTTLSSIELPNSGKFKAQTRRTKSEEELSNTRLHNEILQRLGDIFQNQDIKTVHDDVLQTLSAKLKTISREYRNDDIQCQFEESVKNNAVGCKGEYIFEELVNKINFKALYSTKVFRAEIATLNMHSDLINIIKDWMAELPIKNYDFLGREVDKDQILNSFVKRLRNAVICSEYDRKKLRCEIIDILDQIPIQGHECHNKRIYFNKLANVLIFKLHRIHCLNRINHCKNCPVSDNCSENKPDSKDDGSMEPTKDELKDFLRNEMVDFLQKFNLKLNSKQIEDIESELVRILLNSLETTHNNNDEHVINEIVSLLKNSGEISEHHALYLANLLLDHLKETYNIIGESRVTQKVKRVETFTVLNTSCSRQCMDDTSDFTIAGVNEDDIRTNLDLYVQQLTRHIEEWLANLKLDIPRSHEDSFRQVVVNDLAGDIVDRLKYLELNPQSRGSDQDELENLKYQIFKWINKLVGEEHTETIDKAADLMSRIRSVPVPMLTKPNSNIDECGSGNSNTLLGRRASPPAPMFGTAEMAGVSRQYNSLHLGMSKCCEESLRRTPFASPEGSIPDYSLEPSPDGRYSLNGMTSTNQDYGGCDRGTMSNCGRNKTRIGNIGEPGGFSHGPIDESQMSRDQSPARTFTSFDIAPIREENMGQVQYGRQPSISGVSRGFSSQMEDKEPKEVSMNQLDDISVNQLSEDYDNFLKAWVQELPIPASTPEEFEMAKKMRHGFVNGIWRAVTKLKCQPEVMFNRFHYEDALDEEIEELLGMLPQTPELESKKHSLKVELIEKTSNFNDLIKLHFAPEAFQEQPRVPKGESIYVPRLSTDIAGEDPARLYEELQMLALAEDYILFSRYQNDDPVKAELYRRRLMDRAKQVVDLVKETQGTELRYISPNAYTSDVLNALEQVPLPDENIMKEEADEIMIGLQIDQWMASLPLIRNDDLREQLKRKRLRDGLAKVINEMSKFVDFEDSSGDRELKHEVSMFLEKLPLERDQSLNINYMVDDLTNRLKSRERERIAESAAKRKSVMFHDTIAYNEFIKNLPSSSSLAGIPQTRCSIGGGSVCETGKTGNEAVSVGRASIGHASNNQPEGVSMRQPSINQSALAQYGSNLRGPLLPCCEPFQNVCCRQRVGSAAANISQTSTAYAPYVKVMDPGTYGSFEMEQPRTSSRHTLNIPDMTNMSVLDGSKETTFNTLLDSQASFPQKQVPDGPERTFMFDSAGEPVLRQPSMIGSVSQALPRQSMVPEGLPRQSIVSQYPRQSIVSQAPPRQCMVSQAKPSQSVAPQIMARQSIISHTLPRQSLVSQVPRQSIISQYPRQSMVSQTMPGQSIVSQAPRQSMVSQVPRQNMASQVPRQSTASQVPRQSMVSEIPRQSMASQAARQSMVSNAPRQSMAPQIPGHNMPSQVPGQSIVSQAPRQSMVSNAPRQSTTSQFPGQSMASQLPRQSMVSEVPRQSIVSQAPRQSMASNPQIPRQSMISEVPRQSIVSQAPRQSMGSQFPGQSMASQVPRQSMVSPIPTQTMVTEVPRQSIVSQHPRQSMISQAARQSVVSRIPPSSDINITQTYIPESGLYDSFRHSMASHIPRMSIATAHRPSMPGSQFGGTQTYMTEPDVQENIRQSIVSQMPRVSMTPPQMSSIDGQLDGGQVSGSQSQVPSLQDRIKQSTASQIPLPSVVTELDGTQSYVPDLKEIAGRSIASQAPRQSTLASHLVRDESQIQAPTYASVQEPGSYGQFSFERPVSSSFNQTLPGQEEQYFTIPDSREVSPGRVSQAAIPRASVAQDCRVFNPEQAELPQWYALQDNQTGVSVAVRSDMLGHVPRAPVGTSRQTGRVSQASLHQSHRGSGSVSGGTFPAAGQVDQNGQGSPSACFSSRPANTLAQNACTDKSYQRNEQTPLNDGKSVIICTDKDTADVCIPSTCQTTPQQGVVPPFPGRPDKKAFRDAPRSMKDGVRRKLEMNYSDDDTDYETRREDRGRCRCLERMKRFRKRRICYPCDGYEIDYPQCPSARYFYSCY